MGKLNRFRPSPAMVVASIALFLAVSGIGWAAATIGTSDIQNGAVTAKKLHKKAVTSKKIKKEAVSGAKLSGDQRTLWAAVKSNGDITDQSGGISVDPLGGGGYVIDFGEKVSGRALVATATNARAFASAILCNGGNDSGTCADARVLQSFERVGTRRYGRFFCMLSRLIWQGT